MQPKHKAFPTGLGESASHNIGARGCRGGTRPQITNTRQKELGARWNNARTLRGCWPFEQRVLASSGPVPEAGAFARLRSGCQMFPA
jgi:hypothetical protein